MKRQGNYSVVSGDAARHLFVDESFLASWMQLYGACPWATAGQRAEFVTTWFRIYRSHEPVLVLAHDSNGKLVGLLALVDLGDYLTHAGFDDCEYHGWLASVDYGDEFMPEAIAILSNMIRVKPIEFRYLPYGTPCTWMSSEHPMLGRCEFRKTERLIVRTDDGEKLRAYFKSKSRLRTKMNQLRRSGEVKFRRLYETDEMIQVIDRCEALFDLRKGATYGCLPFRDDPLRRKFLHAEAGIPGLLHVVVLERDDEILAAHIGPASPKELPITGIVHSELDSRFSPGSLLLLELIRSLHEDGFELLDCTPGHESYKTQFGRESQTIYSLTVHASHLHCKIAKTKVVVRSYTRRGLYRMPTDLRDRVQAFRQWLSPVAVAESGIGIEFSRLRKLNIRSFQGLSADQPASSEIPEQSKQSELPKTGQKSLESTGQSPLQSGSSWLHRSEFHQVQPQSTRHPSWRRNVIDDILCHPGTRDEYIAFLRTTLHYLRLNAEMYTRVQERQLTAIAFVIPAASYSKMREKPGGDARFPRELSNEARIICGLETIETSVNKDLQLIMKQTVELMDTLGIGLLDQEAYIVPPSHPKTAKALASLGL